VLFHDDGKVSLDHIYTSPDPRAYFGTLRKLDYSIPHWARPHFAALIAQRRADLGRPITVLDIGCGYGVNAALLRCDSTMDELYERYAGVDASALSRDALLARDRDLVAVRDLDRAVRFVGLDISAEALAYARSAGFLDDAVRADLEQAEPTPGQRDRLGGTDLVISTGCIGYITERTIAAVVRANDRPPWMAHFVLRMYPFEPVAECLAGFGYETTRVGRVFRDEPLLPGESAVFEQRQFVSADEQALVLATLADLGIDPRGLESDGRLYAQLFVSRPVAPYDGRPDPSTAEVEDEREQ
jgi:SAM-dependent methyltransferase